VKSANLLFGGRMIGAVAFITSFVLFTLVSFAVDLPPGSYAHYWFNFPAPEYSPLIIGIVNGVVYGVSIWLVFSLGKRILRARVMEMKVKNDRFYLLDSPEETWIYDSVDGAIETSRTLVSKKKLSPEDVNIFEVNAKKWLSRLQKASKEVSEVQLGKPDARMKGTPKTFLKRCPNCGAEIPIASEECRHCKTKQE